MHEPSIRCCSSDKAGMSPLTQTGSMCFMFNYFLLCHWFVVRTSIFILCVCVRHRDLEGQIFRSGMRLDEIKECLEQAEQNQPNSEPTLTPLPPSDVLSVSMLETEPLPEVPQT